MKLQKKSTGHISSPFGEKIATNAIGISAEMVKAYVAIKDARNAIMHDSKLAHKGVIFHWTG